MTAPIWIADRHLLDETPALAPAIEASGAQLFRTKYVPFSPVQDFGPFTAEDCCIVYGTANFVAACPEHIQPGAYGVTAAIGPEHYYARLPLEWMLNDDFVILPLGVIGARLGLGRRFVRPLDPFKTFAGRVIDSVDDLKDAVDHGGAGPETLCLVAGVKPIHHEVRFVVADGHVVAQGPYGRHKVPSPEVLDICRDLAQRVAHHVWQPARVYMCDVVFTNLGPRVVELNAFACAGLYGCDVEAVVRAVNQAALDDHARWNPEGA